MMSIASPVGIRARFFPVGVNYLVFRLWILDSASRFAPRNDYVTRQMGPVLTVTCFGT